MSGRRKLIGGNWKMHLLASQAEAYVDKLASQGPESETEVVLFPSFPLLARLTARVEGSPLEIGAQDLHAEDWGAHTGDVSGAQIAEAGCSWVLCGHSERRRDHGESDEVVQAKVAAAKRFALTPLICLGETLEERRSGDTLKVLERQLSSALAARPAAFDIAYEPVWAIGTGETATPDLAQEAHAFLRSRLAELGGKELAERTRIVYGGSAKPENASDLIAQQDLDGFLVGGASLDPEQFMTIIRACGSNPEPPQEV